MLPVIAIPFAAPLSTSVIPPVNALSGEPTAPLGTPASSPTVSERAVFASTGASLTALIVKFAVSVAVLKAVVPPLVVVSAVPPFVPVVRSQARKVIALVIVPL